MSYDIPHHVRNGVKTMFNVADAEIMALKSRESGFRDRNNAASWGYIAHELTPLLQGVRGHVEAGLAAGDLLPYIGRLQEKIEVFELDDRDPVKQIFVKATKAMVHSIDPTQYPEAEAFLQGQSAAGASR